MFTFLLFVGYLVLRGALTDFDVRARFSAVLGLMALVLVPFIHVTVLWFRTLHPEPVVLNTEGPSLPGVMLVTLLIPITALMLGNVFLGEAIQAKEIAGALVIGIGLLFIDGRVIDGLLGRRAVSK